ncbi:MAG: hypothetical protein K0R14_232 [Burkholderiales bacterium]|jgi:hypothetical protein|nr:hypothetical protein [Burkholderiales bacterium]
MHFDLLERLKPDYCIELDADNRVISIDHELLKQVNPHPRIKPSFGIPINEFFYQFNDKSHTNYYSKEFISGISSFVTNKNHALVLLNSNILKQREGLYLFIISAKRKDKGVILEFFNLLHLTDLVSKFFSFELWQTFKNTVKQNNNSIVSRHLYMAYQAILPLFLLTNTNEINIQAKPKWNELGELLFYFNPYSKNKKLSSTSGRNLISDGLFRSENDVASGLSWRFNKESLKLIRGNQLDKNQIIILN